MKLFAVLLIAISAILIDDKQKTLQIEDLLLFKDSIEYRDPSSILVSRFGSDVTLDTLIRQDVHSISAVGLEFHGHPAEYEIRLDGHKVSQARIWLEMQDSDFVKIPMPLNFSKSDSTRQENKLRSSFYSYQGFLLEAYTDYRVPNDLMHGFKLYYTH